MADDPNALKTLEAEAAKYEKEDDFLSALDVYEEIVRKGWAKGAHLLALGHCYLKNRQRQNARATWTRASELEPDNAKIREELDHYFPGWESQAQTMLSTSGPPPVIPPAGATVISAPPRTFDEAPPPPPRFADPSQSTIVVETHSNEETRRPKPVPSEPRPARPAPRPAQAPRPTVRHETRSEDTIQTARRTEPAAYADHRESVEGRVNWTYVCSDAAEGLVTG